MRPFTIHYTNNDEFLDHIENLTHERPSYCIFADFGVGKEAIVLAFHTGDPETYRVLQVYPRSYFTTFGGSDHQQASALFHRTIEGHANL